MPLISFKSIANQVHISYPSVQWTQEARRLQTLGWCEV